MTSDEALDQFGLPAAPEHREELRRRLIAETRRNLDGKVESVEVLLTFCVQLFSIGVVEDSLLIWAAKRSSFDAGCMVDVQILCGAGLEATKAYLAAHADTIAADALAYVVACEQSGDFADWTPADTLEDYVDYFDWL